MQIWKTAIYCYQQFTRSYVRVTLYWKILKFTNAPLMLVGILFDSTPKIHIPVSWIQWAPPIVILVSKKGGNTHFYFRGVLCSWNLKMFYLIVSLFSSKSYNDIFHFSLFAWTQKFRGDLKWKSEKQSLEVVAASGSSCQIIENQKFY